HECLDVSDGPREVARHPLDAVFGDEHVVLDADADAFVFLKGGADLGDELAIRGVVGQPLESVGADVYPRLVGKDHPGCEGRAIASDVVNVHPQPVAKAVHIPAAKLLSVFYGYEAETEKPIFNNAGRRCTY